MYHCTAYNVAIYTYSLLFYICSEWLQYTSYMRSFQKEYLIKIMHLQHQHQDSKLYSYNKSQQDALFFKFIFDKEL